MAIKPFVYKVIPTNLKKKSVFLRLLNTQPELAFREIELVVSRDLDVTERVAKLTTKELRGLWEQATEITEEEYRDAKTEVDYAPFYETLLDRAFDGLQKLDIDVAHSQIVALLDNNDEIKAQFTAINRNLRLDVDDRGTAIKKREQVLWFLVLSIINLLNEDND